jgi:hypothetical protein
VDVINRGISLLSAPYNILSNILLSKAKSKVKSSVSPGFAEQTIPIFFTLCYNGSLITLKGRKLNNRQVEAPICGFALSYTMNMFILMILYDLCFRLHNFIIYLYMYGRLKAVCKSRTSVHLGKFPVVRGIAPMFS